MQHPKRGNLQEAIQSLPTLSVIWVRGELSDAIVDSSIQTKEHNMTKKASVKDNKAFAHPTFPLASAVATAAGSQQFWLVCWAAAEPPALHSLSMSICHQLTHPGCWGCAGTPRAICPQQVAPSSSMPLVPEPNPPVNYPIKVSER